MFSSFGNKGTSIKFENGFRVSIQWGPGNYCSREEEDFNAPKEGMIWESVDAEVAVFSPKDGMLDAVGDFITDQVRGYLSTNQVLELLNYVAALDENATKFRQGEFGQESYV